MTEVAETTQTPSETHEPFAVLPTTELTTSARRIWMDEVQPIVSNEDEELSLKMDRVLSGLINRLTVLMEERS